MRWFKGGAALELDRWYRSGDVTANLTQGREILQSPLQGLEEIVSVLRTRNRWSTDSAFDYPSHEPLMSDEFERVARQGYLEAIALALRHSPPVPIETFWLTDAGSDKTEFEMHITDAAEHVSVMVVIPERKTTGEDADGNAIEAFTEHGPASWVVKDVMGGVVVEQTSGRGKGNLPQPSEAP